MPIPVPQLLSLLDFLLDGLGQLSIEFSPYDFDRLFHLYLYLLLELNAELSLQLRPDGVLELLQVDRCLCDLHVLVPVRLPRR